MRYNLIMPRNPDYQEFLDVVSGKKQTDIDEETKASEQEIGWWKQFQIKRAIKHAEIGKATPEELHLLWIHDISLPSKAKERTQIKLKKERFPTRYRQ